MTTTARPPTSADRSRRRPFASGCSGSTLASDVDRPHCGHPAVCARTWVQGVPTLRTVALEARHGFDPDQEQTVEAETCASSPRASARLHPYFTQWPWPIATVSAVALPPLPREREPGTWRGGVEIKVSASRLLPGIVKETRHEVLVLILSARGSSPERSARALTVLRPPGVQHFVAANPMGWIVCIPETPDEGVP